MKIVLRLALFCVLFRSVSVFCDARIRIVSANLTSGNKQSYDPGHGIRILRGLRPHVVLLQEFNYGKNTDADFQQLAEEVFELDPDSDEVREAPRKEVFFYREPQESGIPNGILSRFPILKGGEEDDPKIGNRDFAWARIDLPGPRDLWAYSLHFKSGKHVSTRVEEANALVKVIQQTKEGHPEDFVVAGGDLNTRTKFEKTIDVLGQVVSVEHDPADASGNSNTNSSRKSRYDWVMPDTNLEAWHVPVRLSGKSFPNGLVFDTRSYPSLREIPAVQKSDSAAPQMQHMAVVRDFEIPN